ncbi:uncharacterized protein LOC120844491 [Ixodes scapularis]|uniref:uncharacterized protein LOC120844491 n=1 Tax=Ixodes scapularis TaxID=6945 RepID=UPI001A9DFA91|nr:uncharacterized protein LOC120844491 [Ixodes scapularis]
MPASTTHFVLLCCCIAECFDALCSLVLLLGGDVELNPGPRTTSVPENPSKDNQSKKMDGMLQLLQDVNARTLKFETGQASLISSIDKVRKSQQSMENKLADVNKRLVNIETKALKLDEWRRREELLLRLRRSSPQSEEKIRTVCSRAMNLQIDVECIARAHRMGAFSASRCRPLIVKFANLKARENILSSKSVLENSSVFVNEYFLPATRQARRKLIELAKGTYPNIAFTLCYNKLYVDKKVFTYCLETDSAVQFGEHQEAVASASTNRSSSSPARTSS